MFVFRNSIGFTPHNRMINAEYQMPDIDFTGGGGQGGNTPPPAKDGEGNNGDGDNDNEPDPDNHDDNPNNHDDNPDDKDKEGEHNNSSTGGLEQGSKVEFNGQTYTVDKDGNLIDKDNKVFKEAKDVQAWIDSLQVENPDADLTIDNIRQALDIDITDDEGKPVEFTNDIEGVKNYINSAIELKSNEVAQAAVNKVFIDNPILKQFVDYLTINGGDPRGFGERPDRSKLTVDENSEDQQIAIIKMAAKEFGNATLNDNYIKYLKDAGGLLDEAKAQLANLQALDKKRGEDEAKQAEAYRKQQADETTAYFKGIKDTIDNRKIGEYTLPESIVREVNGQKITLTPDDFFKYLYVQTKDKDGNVATAYQRALANQSEEDARNEELLSAWLMFTGGTYKDLVNMAKNEKEVKTLKLVAKNNNGHGAVRITKPAAKTNPVDDIRFS